MQNADQGSTGELAGEGLRIAIVRARFNDVLTTRLVQACLAELDRLDVDAADIRHVTVPGALEIPVVLKALAESGEHDALIALGCVIRGETFHFELVAEQSAAGVMRVALDHQIPVANAILTVDTEAQAWARADEKGRDAARVAVEMANLMDELSVTETPAKATGKEATKKRSPQKSARRRSRELAMQGLYRWLLAGGDPADVEADIRELDGFDKCDREHFDALLHGSIAQAAALDVVLARHVDRKTTLLSPVEHAVLMIGAYELIHCLEIPYRVAINEAVELAKSFGGTDGHKFVNGVLDKCATELRPSEARPPRS